MLVAGAGSIAGVVAEVGRRWEVLETTAIYGGERNEGAERGTRGAARGSRTAASVLHEIVCDNDEIHDGARTTARSTQPQRDELSF
jgi:hypothetical protein